jgi:hypothetical protein
VSPTDLAIRCADEVVALHRVIESWLTGSAPRTREAFARFADALADEFVIVHPSGAAESKSDIVAALWNAHGANGDGFSIEIRNVTCRVEADPWCVLTYEEWQHDDETTARISTVVFLRSDTAIGVEWVHLHETWLAPVDSR